jgi:ATP-dependent Clp protease ATP-binding subunit ClpC
MTAPPDLREFDEKIADVRREKESAIEAQDFEKAAKLRDRRRSCSPQGELRAEKQWAATDVVAEVDEEEIAEVLRLDRHPGVQADRGGDQPAAAHGGRAAQAGHRPGEAIKAVSQAIRRTRAGLKDPKRPDRLVHLPRPRPASARPSWPRRSPSSCSATRTR